MDGLGRRMRRGRLFQCFSKKGGWEVELKSTMFDGSAKHFFHVRFGKLWETFWGPLSYQYGWIQSLDDKRRHSV